MSEIPRRVKNRKVNKIALSRTQGPKERQLLTDLLDKFRPLERKFANLHDTMADLSEYYHGRYFQEERNADLSGHKLTVNVVAHTVDSYRSYLSSPFDHDVPSRGARPDDHALSNQNEALLYGMDETNQMDSQVPDGQHYMSLKGSAPYNWFIDPDDAERPVKINLQDPESTFPQHDPNNIRKLHYVFYRFPMTVQQFRLSFGVDEAIGFFGSSTTRGRTENITSFNRATPAARSEGNRFDQGFTRAQDDEIVWITWYWDTEWNYLIFNDASVLMDKSFRHNYGIVPWVIPTNAGSPHNPLGKSDVVDSIDMMEYYNNLLSLQADVLEYHAAPMVHTIGIKEHNMTTGPGMVFAGGPDSRVNVIGPTGPPPQVEGQLQRIRSEINQVTGIDQLLFQPNVAPARATGNTIRNMQTQLASKLAQKQHSMGAGLQVMYGDILTTLNKKFPNLRLRYDTMKKDQLVQVDVKAKDIGDSGRNFVIWRPTLNDKLAQNAQEIQKLGAGVQSRRSTMEALGIRDPEFELDEIAADQMTDLVLQQKVQEFSQGIQPGQVQADQESLVRGGVPNQGQAQAPAGGATAPAAAPAGGEDQLSGFIRSLNVPGSVFRTKDSETGEDIIAVTSAVARKTIAKALKEQGIDIKVIRVRKKPEGPSTQIQ